MVKIPLADVLFQTACVSKLLVATKPTGCSIQSKNSHVAATAPAPSLHLITTSKDHKSAEYTRDFLIVSQAEYLALVSRHCSVRNTQCSQSLSASLEFDHVPLLGMKSAPGSLAPNGLALVSHKPVGLPILKLIKTRPPTCRTGPGNMDGQELARAILWHRCGAQLRSCATFDNFAAGHTIAAVHIKPLR